MPNQQNIIAGQVQDATRLVSSQIEQGKLSLSRKSPRKVAFPNPIVGQKTLLTRFPQGYGFLPSQTHKQSIQKHIGLRKEVKKLMERIASDNELNISRYQEWSSTAEEQLFKMRREERRRRAELGLLTVRGRGESRQQEVRRGEERFKFVKGQQRLHQTILKRYNSERLKKREVQANNKLWEIKERMKPVDYREIQKHGRQFSREMKRKLESHLAVIKEKANAGVRPQPPLKIMAVVKAEQEMKRREQQKKREQPYQKRKKISSYSQHVLQHHMPKVFAAVPKQQSSTSRVNKVQAKRIGVEYLRQLRQRRGNSVQSKIIQKKADVVQKSQPRPNPLPHRKEEQYQSIHKARVDGIIAKLGESQRADSLFQELGRMDQKLQRQQKLNRAKRVAEVDPQQYIACITSKLSALQKL